MSLLLENGTKPTLVVNSHDGCGLPAVTLRVGPDGPGADMSMQDFCAFVKYVFTNTDLQAKDERVQLRRWLFGLDRVAGFNEGRKRFAPALAGIEDEAVYRLFAAWNEAPETVRDSFIKNVVEAHEESPR